MRSSRPFVDKISLKNRNEFFLEFHSYRNAKKGIHYFDKAVINITTKVIIIL